MVFTNATNRSHRSVGANVHNHLDNYLLLVSSLPNVIVALYHLVDSTIAIPISILALKIPKIIFLWFVSKPGQTCKSAWVIHIGFILLEQTDGGL